MIGRNLRKYRTNAKLTQQQLARRAGISTSYYASLERGNKSMSVWVLYSQADTLDVSTDCLLYEESRHTQMENIRHLLRGESDDTVIVAENNMIRTLLDNFAAKDEGESPEK